MIRARPALALFAAALLGAPAACSSSTDGPGPVDAGADGLPSEVGPVADVVTPTGDAAPEAADPRPVCQRTSVATTPPDVTITKQPMSAAPTPAGGAIVPGTYKLESAVWYTNDSAVPAGGLRITYKFLSGEWLGAFASGTDPDTTRGGTFATSGTALSLQETCGQIASQDGGPAIAGYSTDGTTLTLVIDAGWLTAAPLLVGYTYRKQ